MSRDYDVMCMLDLDDAYEIGAQRHENMYPASEASPFSIEYDPMLVFEADRGWVARMDLAVEIAKDGCRKKT